MKSLIVVFSLIGACWLEDSSLAEDRLLTGNPPFGSAYRNSFGKLPSPSTRGDRIFAEYFWNATHRISGHVIDGIKTRDDWERSSLRLRQQLYEMLSLDPLPAKTELQATTTGIIDRPDFTVEKVHYQSRPGLYVTANVYVPKGLDKPAPAILYVCGHGQVKIDGVSYGNKVTYQHHGVWFARNGYVCMIIDSVQLGELEGIHHGTHREGMWWWNSRGYTSAGAEAWNCIRALDYLESRSDIDAQRIGVTGRSGGGAYSWWIAALDERIQVACPVAGITDLRNHVIDGCVEGHCDCMYMVNTYRWDYATVAALVAPRPLLICNTDKDRIFPLDGIVRLHSDVRQIYDLFDTPDRLGLLVVEGPHKDVQELQLPVMRWFNKWLKKEETPVASFAEKLFSPQELKVFDQLPADERTTGCYEEFTLRASDSESFDAAQAMERLREKTFGAWLGHGVELDAAPIHLREMTQQEADGVRLSVYEFESEAKMPLRFYLATPVGYLAESLHLEIVDESAWKKQLELGRVGFEKALLEELSAAGIDRSKSIDAEAEGKFGKWMKQIREQRTAYATLTPRGVGMTSLSPDPKYQTHLRRRFMLLGGTFASAQVWDMLRASVALRSLPNFGSLPFHLHASQDMTEVASFATLFHDRIDSLSIAFPPREDKLAPDFLNWSRWVTPSQLLQLVQAKTQVRIR